MKYIIMLGSDFIDGYVDRAEALQAYHEYVADEGEYHDFMLYKMLETHEAPEQEKDIEEYVDSLKSETKALQKKKQLFFGR